MGEKRSSDLRVGFDARLRLEFQGAKVSGTLKGTVLAAYYLLGTTLKYAWRD